MKKTIFLLLLSYSFLLINAQVEYTYDIHGNRISRHIVSVKLDSSDFKTIDSTFNITDELVTNDFTTYEISNYLDDTQISIYPNPTKDIVNIDITGENASENNKIFIYSMNGQLIEQRTETDNRMQIDLSSLPQGTYIMIIETDKFKYKQKIIKQ